MTGTAERNLAWADRLIAGLAANGMDQVVISPGSRSTPLVLACARRREITTHVMTDERSAAFFALGLARASGKPAGLIATSGSAPANWFPAVIEASRTGIPLILMSADRPPEEIGGAANQTIDQTRLFGGHVRAFHAFPPPDESVDSLDAVTERLADAAFWPMPGPVHLNIPFREPLVPTKPPPEPPALPKARRRTLPLVIPDSAMLGELALLMSEGPGAIICGSRPLGGGPAQAITMLGAKLNAPLLADPLSGLRFAGLPEGLVLARADAFLRDAAFTAAHRPRWLLNLGGPPISKALLAFMENLPGDGLIMADQRADWPNPFKRPIHRLHADPALLATTLLDAGIPPAPPEWLDAFHRAEKAAAPRPEEIPEEGGIIAGILESMIPDGLLFCGNSLPVRDLDSFSGTGSKILHFAANRGASGIDGNLSAFLGMAAERKKEKAGAVGLFGDLAFQHDLNGLQAARGLDAVIVVLNNGGGGIFAQMPQAGLPEFERYWLAPGGLDIAAAARAYGLSHRRSKGCEDFPARLAEAMGEPGTSVIEVEIGREDGAARRRAYWTRMNKGSI